GTYFTVEDFDDFMEHIPQRVLVILDEAYFEYAQNIPDYPDSMHYRYDNVITLRTFSKVYGLAGFRVGYGFGHEDLIANLQKVKLPFEPSVPAQIAAVAALKDTEYLNRSIELNKNGMTILSQYFIGKGIKFIPSATNFITVVFDNSGISNNITIDLLKKGVIVRDLTGFGWPNCIRITIGTTEELEYFMECFDKIYNEILVDL
ncbi:MAG: pyridoxal phosphate-dependent aminotransferase, partial [Fidelibacterota bacterium]